MRGPVRLFVGDVAILKKPHACGLNEWRITRVGSDIKAECRGCGRQIMLVRSEFERRLKRLVPRGEVEP